MEIPIHQKINTLCAQQKALLEAFKPSFYRIYNAEDEKAFSLLLDTPGLRITDSVLGQVKELMKIRHPEQKLTSEQQENAALQHIKPYTTETYGVWVYYPWSNRLVHIVDQEEFIDLRTSRNQYKITREERDLLAQKKIGVIGLSVGQSVAVTIAMERIASEIRLVDFDVLELTNLNRIRTGIHNLGLPKVYAVAREIAEIDPFLDVKCFIEGLTEDNMDVFFLEGGKLDLLVEESDGFDIKILSRYKARELGVPVIMEASDRCTVDVERFDLEPSRSILHGLVDHLKIETLKQLKTTEEKIPYMLDMVGLETSSARLKASMLEIDQTITTWPQLASSVTMGGGISADVARRILLNSYTESGRYFVDIEELIGNKKPVIKNPYKVHDYELDYPELTAETIAPALSTFYFSSQPVLSSVILEQIVAAAALAPSAGNNQPWKWVRKGDLLFLFHDAKQSATWEDHRQLISNISLGASLENAIVKANELGYETQYELYPIKDNYTLIAKLSFASIPTKDTNSLALAPYISVRHTNRKKGNRSIIPSDILEEISNQVKCIPEASISFATDDKQIELLSKIISASERTRLLIPQAHYDFYKNELRWSTGKKIESGLDIKTLEITLTEEVGMKVASEERVITLINEWNKGKAFEKISRNAVLSSSVVGLISIDAYDSKKIIAAGRAVERAWLTATKNNIAIQPVSGPLFLYALAKEDNDTTMDEQRKKEIILLHQELQQPFPELKQKKGIFLFRMSIADAPSVVSLRKNIREVYLQLPQ